MNRLQARVVAVVKRRGVSVVVPLALLFCIAHCAGGGSSESAPNGSAGMSGHLGGAAALAGSSTGGSSVAGGGSSTGGISSAGNAGQSGQAGQGQAGIAGAGGVAGQAGSAGLGGTGGTGNAGAAGAAGATTAVCPGGDYADDPVPGGTAMASIVCSGFTFTEGPTWLVSGNKLLFSDFQFQDSASNFQGRIMQLDPAGQPGQQCTEFLADVGANGLAVAPSGNLLAARHLTQAIGTIDPSNPMVTDIVSDFMGQAFSSPNDLTVRSDGTIYFTDPAWQLGNRTQELDHGVYRVDPQGNVSLVQSFPDRRPNGIVLSPDESKLYVSMIDPNQILVMDVAADGTASNPQTFVDSASDGMTVDCAGNLYATSLTVNIYDPTGQNIGTITLEGDSAGLPDPTNVAFGGANRTTLYVTGSGYVRSVELQIPGYPF